MAVTAARHRPVIEEVLTVRGNRRQDDRGKAMETMDGGDKKTTEAGRVKKSEREMVSGKRERERERGGGEGCFSLYDINRMCMFKVEYMRIDGRMQ